MEIKLLQERRLVTETADLGRLLTSEVLDTLHSDMPKSRANARPRLSLLAEVRIQSNVKRYFFWPTPLCSRTICIPPVFLPRLGSNLSRQFPVMPVSDSQQCIMRADISESSMTWSKCDKVLSLWAIASLVLP
jgi:hypothetical protein